MALVASDYRQDSGTLSQPLLAYAVFTQPLSPSPPPPPPLLPLLPLSFPSSPSPLPLLSLSSPPLPFSSLTFSLPLLPLLPHLPYLHFTQSWEFWTGSHAHVPLPHRDTPSGSRWATPVMYTHTHTHTRCLCCSLPHMYTQCCAGMHCVQLCVVLVH